MIIRRHRHQALFKLRYLRFHVAMPFLGALKFQHVYATSSNTRPSCLPLLLVENNIRIRRITQHHQRNALGRLADEDRVRGNIVIF